MQFANWCNTISDKVNGHDITLLSAQANKINGAVKVIAKALPSHYIAPERMAHIMKRLGRTKVASFLTAKLPRNRALRSGDLAEILGVSYVTEATQYNLAIRRLRWKDHRDMAMRGEDILALTIDAKGRLLLLKGEVKSRANLTAAVVKSARSSLGANQGRPSAHGLSFVADRLFEEGKTDLVDKLDDAQLNRRLGRDQVTHLVFTFSGNDPGGILRADLQKYKGRFAQIAVGLRIETHQKFIASVFEAARGDGL